MKYRKQTIICVLLLLSLTAYSQGNGGDFFRNIGKIYVVIAVMVVTFIGIIGFLIHIERKIKKIEQEISSHE